MKYILLVVLSLWIHPALAEAEIPEENIMIITSPENYNVSQNENLPKCDNQVLINDVKEAIRQYLLQRVSGASIIEQRAHRLILNNIDEYREIPLNQFDIRENYFVANEIVMTKINRNIPQSDMRLCVSNGKKPLYLLIYPEDFRYRVQIINFIPPNSEGNNFSIFYTPEVKQYEKFEI